MDGGYKNYNSYGGGGGGGGGGFMPGEMNSPSGGKGGDRDNKTLRPVTVKQIVDASQPFPEANYQIDGADVASVLFIGQVRNISTQSTNVTYKIDDGTGEIEVKKWIDSGSADSMDTDEGKGPGSGKNAIQLNGYARISGAVKSFGNKRYVGAHNVLPVTDINELHCHILEATVVHLFFTRGPPGGANAGAKNASAAGGDAMMGGAEDYGAGQNRALMSMSPLAKRVYQVLRTEPQDDTGLHVQQIAAKMNVPATDVARAGEELLGAGVIFSTSDEQTWAILEY